jgi:predicted DNA-binding transcriptional regulator AlpA
MASPRPLLSTAIFCEQCQKNTRFLPIPFAIALTGVSRSTVYNWMERGRIHWLELPSGRRLICEHSLLRDPSNSMQIPLPPPKNSPKLSNTVQFCKLTRS